MGNKTSNLKRILHRSLHHVLLILGQFLCTIYKTRQRWKGSRFLSYYTHYLPGNLSSSCIPSRNFFNVYYRVLFQSHLYYYLLSLRPPLSVFKPVLYLTVVLQTDLSFFVGELITSPSPILRFRSLLPTLLLLFPYLTFPTHPKGPFMSFYRYSL